MRADDPSAETGSARTALLALALFYASWSKFLIDSATALYGIEYLFDAVVVALVLWATPLRKRRAGMVSVRDVGWAAGGGLVLTVLLVAGRIAMLELELAVWVDATRLAQFPAYPDPILRAIDLTVGLALVALSEELVFRRLMAQVADERGWSVRRLYILSSVAFASIHAPQGMESVAGALLAGLLLMALYRRSGSLAACIGAHYLADLLLFSDALSP